MSRFEEHLRTAPERITLYQMEHEAGRTPDDLFDGFPESLAIYQRVEQALSAIGHVHAAVKTSQVAFGRRKGFAYVWRPGQYVDSVVPAVLSIALPYELTSDRFKEVAHPTDRVWMHHLNCTTPSRSTTESAVGSWMPTRVLAECWLSAG